MALGDPQWWVSAAGPLVSVVDLEAVLVLPVPKTRRDAIKASGQGGQMVM